jgi:ketosteroid isomerase-like protein
MREIVERLGPDPPPEAVLGWLAGDPAYRHLHPDIEFDSRATDGAAPAHGLLEAGRVWAQWVEAWESYVFRHTEYRDLGDWVLALVDVRARGRDGLEVKQRVFEIYKVRDRKIAVYRSFFSEQEALDSAGLSE